MDARRVAGFEAATGEGLVVNLDDGEVPAGGNPNDYVIHSQDVQAIANGLWSAGAEAVSVNGERVLPTTALLCVGNTLLINGSVHAPPYEFAAVSAAEDFLDRFDADPLVTDFASIARQFGLGYSRTARSEVVVPAFEGLAPIRIAEPT